MTARNDAKRIWLPYVTGLRGLAALYVVLHHLLAGALAGNPNPYPDTVLHFLFFGSVGVSLFIVVSGYCLMMPIVSRPDCLPREGWRTFFKRRARRLLPTYYLVLGLAVVLVATRPELAQFRDEYLCKDSVVAHLLLFQNWSAYPTTLDGPLWSIATEVQIYCLIPLIVWGWRRVGKVAVIIVLGALSFVPHALLGGDFTHFHYLLSFMLGGLAADIVHRPRTGPDFWSRLPWRDLTLMSWSLVIGCMTVAVHSTVARTAAVDIAGALATAILLVHLGTEPASRLARWLSSPMPYSLGLISYSMYVTHYPILQIALFHTSRIPWQLDFTGHFLYLVAVLLPLILVAAYLFYLVAEKPFLSVGSDALAAPWSSVLRAALTRPPECGRLARPWNALFMGGRAAHTPGSPVQATWLPYLTGMRGGVVLLLILDRAQWSAYAGRARDMPNLHALCFGEAGMALSLVISGYCLGLCGVPGVRDFLLRRVKRILPPYYLTLALCVAVVTWQPLLRYLPDRVRPTILDALMLQNGSLADSPWWSMAVVCQVYCLVPLFLLAWRRMGLARVAALGVAVAGLPALLNQPQDGGLHLVGAFLIGAAAADMVHRPAPQAWQLPWLGIMGVMAMAVAWMATDPLGLDLPLAWTVALCASIGGASLLVYLGLCQGQPSLIRRLREMRILYEVGIISYSLYLVNGPLMAIVHAATSRLPWGPQDSLSHAIFLMVETLLLALAVSYSLYLIAEAPCLSRRTPAWKDL